MTTRMGLLAFVLLGSAPTYAAVTPQPVHARGFEANAGQVGRPDVRWVWRGDGLIAAFTDQGVEIGGPSGTTVRLKLAAVAPGRPAGEGLLPGRVSYLHGSDPGAWVRGLPLHERVVYRDVRPGVDLVFHADRGPLELDVEVARRASVEGVALEVEGALALCIDADGDAVAVTPGGELRLRAPEIVQSEGNGPHACRWLLRGSSTLGFEVEGTGDGALVIDPVLTFSSYLGGGGGESVNAMAVDGAGALYVTGSTTSMDFPLAGPLRGPCPTCGTEVFVSKIDPATGTLVYSTYLGGDDSDYARAIAVDVDGVAYVAGETASTDFPLANPVQPVLEGHVDAFVTAIGPAGSTLLFSTYLGGAGSERASGIGLGGGQLHVAGTTWSDDFPVVNPLQPAKGKSSDAFVARFALGSWQLAYATWMDGGSMDHTLALAVDVHGNDFFVGVLGDDDVWKLAASGAAIEYRARLAGHDYEDGVGAIALDSQGAAHVVLGSSYNSDENSIAKVDAAGDIVYDVDPYPLLELRAVAVDDLDSVYVAGLGLTQICGLGKGGAANGAYVAHLDGAGNVATFATAIGGDLEFSAACAIVARATKVHVAGFTRDSDFPVVVPFQARHGGGETDAFVATVDLALPGPPSAAIAGWHREGPPPLTIDFEPASTCPTTTDYLWSFGDGATSTVERPSHTYTAIGHYDVSLTTTNAVGSTTSTRQDFVRVCDVTSDFIAAPLAGAAPLAVTFHALADGDVGGVSWLFGDGASSTQRHVTHVYTQPGAYDVTLQVHDASGRCTAWSYPKPSIEVVDVKADFSAVPRVGPRPLTVPFADRSVGQVFAYLWQFDDGSTSELRNPSHVYSDFGFHDVSLAVVGEDRIDDERKNDFVYVTLVAPSGIVASPGPDPLAPAQVKGFDVLGGAQAAPDLVAYGVLGYGANVAAGSIDGTGLDEVLTGPGPGAVFGPQVRAFTAASVPIPAVNFYAYGTLRYGVNVVAAGVDPDLAEEIVTTPGPGAVFGPHLRGWNHDGAGLAPLPGCSAFVYATPKYGANAGRGDVAGDGLDEVLTAPGPGPMFTAQVRAFRYDPPIVALAKVNFDAFAGVYFGARVDGADVDGDGWDEILVGHGPSPANTKAIAGFDVDDGSIAPKFTREPADDVFYGAEPRGGGDLDGDGDLWEDFLWTNGPGPARTSQIEGLRSGGYPIDTVDFVPFLYGYGAHAAIGSLGF